MSRGNRGKTFNKKSYSVKVRFHTAINQADFVCYIRTRVTTDAFVRK